MAFNLAQAEKYFDEQMKITTQSRRDLQIDEVNRCLARWQPMGVWLTSMQRKADAELFVAQQAHDTFIDGHYHATYFECKSDGVSSPTSAIINSKMRAKFGAELDALKNALQESTQAAELFKRLRHQHDRFVTILSTYSANLRTDWVYANQSDGVTVQDSPRPAGAGNSMSMDEANEVMGA